MENILGHVRGVSGSWSTGHDNLAIPKDIEQREGGEQVGFPDANQRRLIAM